MDLSVEPPPPGYKAAATLIFRLDPEPADPFAATGAADVRVLPPEGGQALAFYDQDFMAVNEGGYQRRVPIGRPYWRAYLPKWPENGALTISSGGRRWTFRSAGVPPATASGGRNAGGAGAEERWRAPLEYMLPADDAGFGCAPPYWTLTRGGAWKPAATDAHAAAMSVWRPVLFWSSEWGNFGGAARPDIRVAQDMDALLSRAAERGERRPLVILDGAGFEREGMFNWDTHPLRGRVHAPGEIFSQDEGLDFYRRTMRYAIARWGLAKSVQELLMTARLSHPAAALFHAKLATSLALWPIPQNLSVKTFNPLACEPPLAALLGSFKRDAPQTLGPWKADNMTSAAEAKVVDEQRRGEDAASMQIQARDPRTTTLTLINTFHIAGPAMGIEPDNLSGADTLLFDVWIPPEAAPDMRIGIHVRDRDGTWFQTLLPGMIRPGDWNTYALDISGKNRQRLKPVDAKKLWTDYSRQRIGEIGLHVYSIHSNWTPPHSNPLPLSARFDNIRAVSFSKPEQVAPTIACVTPAPDGLHPCSGGAGGAAEKNLARGELWERHFTVSKTFSNPFDPCVCDVRAVVTTPSGRVISAPAFFNQLCERRQNKNGDEIVEPLGAEFFTVRFRAQESGPHSVVLQLREGGRYKVSETWQADARFMPDGTALLALPGGHWRETRYEQPLRPDGRRRVETVNFEPGKVTAELKLESPTFVVGADARKFQGFIHAAADKRHFQYDDGAFYYPIGPCLRSPSDARLPYLADTWSQENIERLGRRGTYQYDDYLAKFSEAGINWTRIWMCSWWCALEWRRDWHGYQGLGRYNMLNAWRMDYLLKKCEEYGIRVDLGLTNHGQFTLDIDTEWNDNPYNAALGGPLRAASEFFTSARAKIAHQNKLRYVVARFAHSPSIFAWSLCSEMEFTEEYERHVPWGRPDDPAPNIENWVGEMAGCVKAIDPYRHLVTTHFSHPARGEGALQRPEIDFASSNAYSAFEELRTPDGLFDAAYALAAFWAGNVNADANLNGRQPRQNWEPVQGFHIFNKPALVEEQGRHWLGVETKRGALIQNNSRDQLDADLHAGLWGSMVQPLGGATGYWWWLHVHFDNRYSEYKALAKFMDGEDMRPLKGETPLEPVFRSEIQGGSEPLCGRAMKSNLRMFAWIYHPHTPLGLPVNEVSGGQMHITKLNPGTYTVEYWDTYKGAVMRADELTVKEENERIELKLPPVNRDLAIKVKLKK